MPHRAPCRVLTALALLVVFPLAGHASFLEQRTGQFQILEKEVSYRPGTEQISEWKAALASQAGWTLQATAPFAVPRGALQVWAKFDLPAVSAPRQIYLQTSPWERVEFFIVRDGRLADRQLTGTLVPAGERTLNISMTSRFTHSGFAAVDLLPETHTTVFVRLTTSQRYRPIPWLKFYLWDAKQVQDGERADRIFQGLYLGVMLVLVIYNLGLFLVLRERSYLYYVLMEVGNVLFWGNVYGLTSEYLWPEHPAWDYYYVWLIFGLSLLAGIQFMRHYLATAHTVPLGDVVLRWLAIAGVIVSPFALLISRNDLLLGGVILTTPAFFTFWAALVVTCLAFRRGQSAARHFLAAFLCAFVGTMIQIAGMVDWLPSNGWTTNSSQIGGAAMGIILSMGLGFRLRQVRDELTEKQLAEARQQSAYEREKRQLVEQQSGELEIKVRERTAELAASREKAEGFLSNILPQAIIAELNARGVIEPRRHEEVSILFTDFSGFTEAVATIPAKRLVQELDEIFRAFDEIASRLGLEKIKTIGDAYMAAAGLPMPAADHAARCVRAGLALTRFIENRNRTAALKWNLRVGVHSGAVVAGVVGKNKYAYDVWGDTVNLASRMESASERNRVNISAYTYDLVKDRFDCEYRDKLAAKGKGVIDMYFVLGEKPAPAEAAEAPAGQS